MRSRVVKALRPLHGVAVENPAYPGTPDVNFIEGWLELKWLRSWPKGATTIVRLEHYTAQQRLWIRKRAINGGNVGLLLQCKKEWMLFRYPNTDHIGKANYIELRGLCSKYWGGGLKDQELINALLT